LDNQYRRELVRVYLTNVESICRRFCEEKRQRLAWLQADAASFKAWWRGLSSEKQRQLTSGRGEAILKVSSSSNKASQADCAMQRAAVAMGWRASAGRNAAVHGCSMHC
jgi:hypothetical protein